MLENIQKRHLHARFSLDIAVAKPTAKSRSAFSASTASQPHFFSRNAADLSSNNVARFNASKADTALFSESKSRTVHHLQRANSYPITNNPKLSATSFDAVAEQQAVRARVSSEFVLGTHMQAIQRASEIGHFAVSFRSAGKATLDALASGAPAKGHDILEKTIKEGSIRKNYPPNHADAVLDALKDAELLGYVGHWDKTSGALLGIYMGPEHGLGDQVEDGIFKIDVHDLDHSLAALKARKNWKTLPFTGDYDMHDMISFYGQRATVPSDSRAEKQIIDILNKKIAEADPLRQNKSVEYNPVRHGPQVNYVAYAKYAYGDKKKEAIVYSVGVPDFPVAFICRGEWTIVNNAEEHAALYQKMNVKLKETWRSVDPRQENRGGMFLEKLPDGLAKLSRRKSN